MPVTTITFIIALWEQSYARIHLAQKTGWNSGENTRLAQADLRGQLEKAVRIHGIRNSSPHPRAENGKARGDRELVARLIEHEQRRSPGAGRLKLMQDVLYYWERDSR